MRTVGNVAVLAAAVVTIGCKREPSVIHFGTSVDNNLQLAGPTTRFPALTEIRYVASPIQCRDTQLTYRVMRKDQSAQSMLDEGTVPWEAAYQSLSRTVGPIGEPGQYTVRILCGADAVAVGDFTVDCMKQPRLMSEWQSYLSTDSCVKPAYVCANFNMNKILDEKLLDVWPLKEPRGGPFVWLYQLRKHEEAIRHVMHCTGDGSLSAMIKTPEAPPKQKKHAARASEDDDGELGL